MGVNKVGLSTGETLIDISNDTVTPETLAEGETAHNAQGEPITGTMTAGIDTSDATAAADEILVDKTAYVNGEKVTGTMANNGDTSKSFDGLTETSVTIPAGYTSGGTISLTDDIRISLREWLRSNGWADTIEGRENMPISTLLMLLEETVAQDETIPTALKNVVSGNSTIILPDCVTGSIRRYAFYQATTLKKMDAYGLSSIQAYAFNNCSQLSTLILRKTSAIVSLGASNVFTSTPIASGTGYIYVPTALLSTYKAATNWSKHSAQFRAIEDYPDVCG